MSFTETNCQTNEINDDFILENRVLKSMNILSETSSKKKQLRYIYQSFCYKTRAFHARQKGQDYRFGISESFGTDKRMGKQIEFVQAKIHWRHKSRNH